MVQVGRRPAVVAVALAVLALAVIAAPPAQAATVDGYATAWFVRAGNPTADYFNPYVNPTDPPNPLGASDNLCQDSTFATNVFELTFGSFAIPGGSTINGIEVTIDAGIGAGDSPDVTLTNGSNNSKSDTKNFTPPPAGSCAATTTTVLGSSTDDWNTTLTAADFSAGNFGVRIAGAIFMDSINIKVYFGNSAPTADADGPYVVPEGGSVGLDGTGSSDPDGDTLTFAWDLDNDGAFDDAFGDTPTFSAAGFDGPDSQTIRLKVNDGTVDSAPDTTTVTITNVAPTVSNLTANAVDEGGTTTLEGDISDPGAADTFTLDIDWDGDTVVDQSVNLPAGTTDFSVDHVYPDDDPTGTPADNYTIGVTVTDDDGGSDTDTTSITVSNVAPTITSLNATSPVDENGSTTLTGTYTDPGTQDTFALDVDWDGDLAFDETVAVSGGSFSVPHQYLDDDPSGTPADTYTVNVRLTDDDTGADTDSTSVTVDNVDPVLTSLSVTSMIDEDGTVSLTGTLTDVGTLDTHSVTVDWGEGAPEAATVVQGAGSASFSASHQYLDDDPSGTPQDTYTITVTVTDDDTGSDTATIDTLVKNVAPVIDSVASDATFDDKAEEGEPVTVSGTFSDVGTLDTHTGSVDWGDGTVTPATIGTGTFSASHAYAAGGVYTVEVTITDDDTGEVSATTTAVVTGVGINGGVLQIVGTAGDDHVDVQPVNGEIDVFASFVTPHHRRFDAAAVASVEMWLCEGDDHGNVHPLLTLDAVIHGDDGDDMLWGGSGNDTVEGGEGADMLWGRNGNDLLDGGPDVDKLFGGKGTNTLIQ